MNGKYNSRLRFNLVRIQRVMLRLMLRPLVPWSPLEAARNGYTLIIGCQADLIPVLLVNLQLLARQDRADLARILLVFDRPADQLAEPVERMLAEQFADLPITCLYYSRWQKLVAGIIGWAWVYSWMSWCIGIAHTQTRYAMLHDFDSFLIEGEILRERYKLIRERGDEYVGVRYYGGNGVQAGDRVAATYELIFDAAYVRQYFRPIHLFNHVTLHRGRTIDWDTFLWAQTRSGQASIAPIDEAEMVHPSQMICQFTQLMVKGEQPGHRSNLLFLPYLWMLAGREEFFQAVSQALASTTSGRIPFFTAELDLRGMTLEKVAWLRKQAFRLEYAIVGDVRSTVAEYFECVEGALIRCEEMAIEKTSSDMMDNAAQSEVVEEQRVH